MMADTPIYTLLMRLAGPMQSYGTIGRFNQRETATEPTKSAVIGIVTAALGLPRGTPLDDYVSLRMGVRVDRQGLAESDFQTASAFLAAKATPPALPSWSELVNYQRVIREKYPKTAVTVIQKHYLADAAFLVGLEGPEELLESIQNALRSPVFALALGRRAFPPGSPVFLPNGLCAATLEEALASRPWIAYRPWRPWERPESLRVMVEETQGASSSGHVNYRDQPLSTAPNDRRFGPRWVREYTVPCPDPDPDQTP